MKFGILLETYANTCKLVCLRFSILRTELAFSDTFTKLLIDEIKNVDQEYKTYYNNYLTAAKAAISSNGHTTIESQDSLSTSIFGLYEFAVWNLIAIEKISKKHDKIHSVKITSIIHAIVSRNTFLYRHLSNSELYKMIPLLERDTDAKLSSSLFLVSPSSKASEKNTITCSVCLGNIKCSIKLDCDHSFCLNCVSEMASHFFSACPTCRQEVAVSPLLSTSKKILGQAPNETFSLLVSKTDGLSRSFFNRANNNFDDTTTNALAGQGSMKHYNPTTHSTHSTTNITTIDTDDDDDDDDHHHLFEIETLRRRARISKSRTASTSSDYGEDPTPPQVDDVLVFESLRRLSSLMDVEILCPDFLADVQYDHGAEGVSETDRCKLMIWLRQLSEFFALSPATYAGTVSLLDSMLATTRIKPEHGDLAGMACLYLVAKIDEPEELQPTLRELRINCGSAFSETDISRMADIVERRVGAAKCDVNAFHFVDDLAVLCGALGGPSVVSLDAFKNVLTKRILACFGHYELLSFRPSTLALAMFSMLLRRAVDVETKKQNCESTIQRLRSCLQILDWDLDNCCRCINRLMPCPPTINLLDLSHTESSEEEYVDDHDNNNENEYDNDPVQYHEQHQELQQEELPSQARHEYTPPPIAPTPSSPSSSSSSSPLSRPNVEWQQQHQHQHQQPIAVSQ